MSHSYSYCVICGLTFDEIVPLDPKERTHRQVWIEETEFHWKNLHDATTNDDRYRLGYWFTMSGNKRHPKSNHPYFQMGVADAEGDLECQKILT